MLLKEIYCFFELGANGEFVWKTDLFGSVPKRVLLVFVCGELVVVGLFFFFGGGKKMANRLREDRSLLTELLEKVIDFHSFLSLFLSFSPFFLSF